MKRMIAISTIVFVLGCYGRGSPDSQSFSQNTSSDVKFTRVDFAILKSQVLTPYGCVNCHGEMNEETGVLKYLVPGNPDESEIYQQVRSGKMPRSGPKVADSRIEILRQYILALNESVQPSPQNPAPPTPPTPPSPPPPNQPPLVEATFKSIQYYLIQKSCLDCHSTNVAKGKIVLDNYDDLKANYADALGELKSGDMPPNYDGNHSGKPVPTEEWIGLFEKWGTSGFPL